MVPLLPKLRGHFAEFLNKGSSARLRILSLPTVSVLVRVSSHSIVPFLGSLESVASLLIFRSPSHLDIKNRDLPLFSTYLLRRALPFTRSTYPPASVHLSNIQR